MNRHILLFAVASALVACTLVSAQSASDVYPIEPEDEGLSKGRFQFRVGYDGPDLFQAKFRIVLSRDEFDTLDYVLDQVEEPSIWAYVHDQDADDGAICHLRKPLEHGVYEWRVDLWNGMEWVEGNDTFTLYVDTIPPADVEGVRLDFDRDRGQIEISWDPVSTDQSGEAEYVSVYHVYRYTQRSMFLMSSPFEVGVTDTLGFVDTDENVLSQAIVFYLVVAEDEAGNTVDRMHRSARNSEAFR